MWGFELVLRFCYDLWETHWVQNSQTGIILSAAVQVNTKCKKTFFFSNERIPPIAKLQLGFTVRQSRQSQYLTTLILYNIAPLIHCCFKSNNSRLSGLLIFAITGISKCRKCSRKWTSIPRFNDSWNWATELDIQNEYSPMLLLRRSEW